MLFTPAKVDQQQQRHRQQYFLNRNYEDSLQKPAVDVSPNDTKSAKKAYGQYLLDQVYKLDLHPI